MGAPRKNKITVTAAGTFQAEVPFAKGDKRRIRRTFQTRAQAQVWLTAAYAALDAGQPVPEPAATVLARPCPQAGTPFRVVAEEYARERFQYANSAGGDRELQVRADLKRMSDWFDDRGLNVEDILREHARDLLTDVAKPQQVEASTDDIDPEETILKVDAEKLYARSTIKRRIKAGKITTSKDHKGRVVLNLAETHRACGTDDGGQLRRGPRGRGLGYDRLDDFRNTLLDAMAFARTAMRLTTADDLDGLRTPRRDEVKTPKAAPVSLAETAQIAAHLHVVHQLVLWLLRVLGVRISEAYGIHVMDVTDLGQDRPGVIHIHRQGGRAFYRRRPSGELEQSGESERLKTHSSERHILVPRPLMAVIRTVIVVFHTDELGIVDPEARLIPALTVGTIDHQGAFREALTEASKRAGVAATEDSLVDAATKPHSLRGALVSQLTDRNLPEVAKRRWFGHVAGTDVHLGNYFMDDPNLVAAMKINEAVESDLEDSLPAGLMIPTSKRCTTGQQPALHVRAEEIDAALAGFGWLAERDARGARLFGTADIAKELRIAQSTTRRYIAALLPNAARTNKGDWRLTWAQVETLRRVIADLVKVDALTANLGLSPDEGLEALQKLGAKVVIDGNGQALTDARSAARLAQHLDKRAAMTSEYVSMRDAARILGVSVSAILAQADAGMLTIEHLGSGPAIRRSALQV